MERSRIGGSILKAGADYSKDGRVSLLQFNSNEIEELQGEVEEFIHFFIDSTDLISLNFTNIFVTSQH
ncbi:PF09234 domain protein [Leptospira interrogans serovar Pomona str. UT364]|nr:PF09234 domain protein [Leptospira interrogans serovar Pomona str. UT364]